MVQESIVVSSFLGKVNCDTKDNFSDIFAALLICVPFT